MTPLHHTTALFPTGDGDEIEVAVSFTIQRNVPIKLAEPREIDVLRIVSIDPVNPDETLPDGCEEAEAIDAACWDHLKHMAETNETDRAEAMADARAERECEG